MCEIRTVWSLVSERAVVLDEVEQVRHLLEVGRDVRVVPQEVHVVELEVDDVLDRAVLRLKLQDRSAAAAVAVSAQPGRRRTAVDQSGGHGDSAGRTMGARME